MTLERFEQAGERFAGIASLAVAMVALFHGEWPKMTAFVAGAILFELYAIRRAVSASGEPK
jgi:hypothetical protein